MNPQWDKIEVGQSFVTDKHVLNELEQVAKLAPKQFEIIATKEGEAMVIRVWRTK